MGSQFGSIYSALIELEYVDAIRMSTIDPMHNLFQGTAKRTIKLWLKLGIMDDEKMTEIQNRVVKVEVESNVGTLSRNIASSVCGFTTDQWKNWTNIFSLYSLKNILPDKYMGRRFGALVPERRDSRPCNL